MVYKLQTPVFTKTIPLNEMVNCTEPSSSISIPCTSLLVNIRQGWRWPTVFFYYTRIILIKPILIWTLLIKALPIKTKVRKTLHRKTLLRKTLLRKTLLRKTLLRKTLLRKTLLTKALLLMALHIKTQLIRHYL
jgi:hypothetical protein